MQSPQETARGARFWLGRLSISLAALLICAGALEIGARAWLAAAGGERITDHRLFRLTQPAPYQGAPYFSAEFVAEAFAQPGGWSTPEGTRLVIPDDFDGTHFHTANGRRRTAFQPAAAGHTVYLVGGSTMYNSEVPDEHTIASNLQRLFRDDHGELFRVENLGATSVNVTQQVERLRTIPLQPGDLVVFFDGANDVLQSLYFDNPDGWIVGQNRKAVKDLGAGSRAALKTYTRLRDRSAFVRWLLNPFDEGALPPHLQDEAAVEARLEDLAETYRRGILEASEISVSSGALFFHFLQPNLFTLASPTQYERELVENFSGTHIIPAGIGLTFRRGYPALRDVVHKVTSEGVRSRDISDVLDLREEGEEFYLDWIHVNHVANRRIAERIYTGLDLRGVLPDSLELARDGRPEKIGG